MLPEALRSTPQWLVSGEDKAPRSVKTGHYADVRDRTQYVTYDEAVAYATNHGYNIGFALTHHDPFAVIDLDAPDTAEQQARHQQILEAFDSYAELSRSGKGVHIWVVGTIPRGVRRDKVELYSDSRYMICTGHMVIDRPVTDQQELLTRLFEDVARASLHMSALIEKSSLLSDAEVVQTGSDAVNGEKFDRLCQGTWEGEYPSQSEADFALMDMLCFYSKSNDQCRRIFRMTGLGKRQKAQRDKYLDYMIAKYRAEETPDVDFTAFDANMNGERVIGNPITPDIGVPIPIPATVVSPAIGNGKGKPDRITYPPGFIGEIATYMTRQLDLC